MATISSVQNFFGGALSPEAMAGMTASLNRMFSGRNPRINRARSVEKSIAFNYAVLDEQYPPETRIEAREWLAEGKHLKQKRFVHVWSPAGTSRFIEKLYAAGAAKVWVAQPKPAGGEDQTSDVVILLLPDAPEQRLALSEIHQRQMAKVWCSEPNQEAPAPVGKYLLFQFT